MSNVPEGGDRRLLYIYVRVRRVSGLRRDLAVSAEDPHRIRNERVEVLFFSWMCGSAWGLLRRRRGPYVIPRPGVPAICRCCHPNVYFSRNHSGWSKSYCPNGSRDELKLQTKYMRSKVVFLFGTLSFFVVISKNAL